MPRLCSAALAALLLAGCPRRDDTTLKSDDQVPAAQRAEALCAWLICPAAPRDVVFVVKKVESDVPFGSGHRELRAVMRVTEDDVAQWGRNCKRARLDARPPWYGQVTNKLSRWDTTAVPDTFRCGEDDLRWVYVKDRLVAVQRRVPDR